MTIPVYVVVPWADPGLHFEICLEPVGAYLDEQSAEIARKEWAQTTNHSYVVLETELHVSSEFDAFARQMELV